VIGGASNPFDVTLTPTPAALRFRWSVLDPMGFSIPNCNDAIPESFEVVAYAQSSALAEHTFVYCDSPPGYQPMPDPDRSIDGDDLNGVVVRVLDGSGAVLGAPLEFPFDPPGAGKTLDFVIECTGDDCMGTVMAGEPVTGNDSGSETDGADSGTG
jgi:hypothetical protein